MVNAMSSYSIWRNGSRSPPGSSEEPTSVRLLGMTTIDSQSEEMAKALKRAGKSVKLISLSHEDRWPSQGATREQILKAVVSFLERNDPPH